MPPNATPPPPPRPDPVTLDQIYTQLTAVDTPYDSKAYHLVALNTIAFHPSVKLYLFEDATATPAGAAASPTPTPAEAALHKVRREKLVKGVAFLLAQRNNAVCHECRWETVSLLGELCRMDNAHAGAPTSALGVQEAKLNGYAKENLEFLAQLPWFVPAINAIKAGGGSVDADAADDAKTEPSSADATSATPTSSSSRAALKAKLHAAREAGRGGSGRAGGHSGGDVDGVGQQEEDEDVVIALMDIRRALPACRRVATPGGGPTSTATTEVTWSEANREQARDLMFVDASTSMLHLIPTVSRGCSDVCAQCQKRQTSGGGAGSASLLRCSSCKAVYYCSAACQKAHWATVHRTPCRAYKERCDTILEQYYAANSQTAAGRKRKQKDLKTGEVVILEVPLEPSLFFETRRYLYDHRDESFAKVEFSDYFMKYTVRGS